MGGCCIGALVLLLRPRIFLIGVWFVTNWYNGLRFLGPRVWNPRPVCFVASCRRATFLDAVPAAKAARSTAIVQPSDGSIELTRCRGLHLWRRKQGFDSRRLHFL